MKKKPKKSPTMLTGRMWLVVLRTNLDELPIALCASRKEAWAVAKLVTNKQADDAAEVMGVDHAGRVCTAIITFTNGRPTKLDIIDDWDEDQHGAAKKRQIA